jgi:glycosyltransferase involved in cell wall biosynthesis
MIAHTNYENDNRVIRYAETLANLGHTVDVIALSPGGKRERRRIGRVNVYPVHSRDFREKSPLSHLWQIMVFFVRAAALVTRRDLKKHYDLVHVHSVPDFLVFTAFFPKLRGAKVILDIHDILPEFYISKFGKSNQSLIYRLLVVVEWLSARFGDHIIVANDIWRAKLISRSAPEGKCTAILNFPDRTIFRRNGRTRRDDKVIMIYPGTLNKHQGLDIALRAFGLIKDEIRTAEFHIYGVGPEEEALKRLARELDLGDRVRFSGYRPIREMAAVVENADVGVVPKRNNTFGNEAFSTKTLEFMAMGVPVIVADTKVDRHYFDDSVVKFFRSGDEKSLAEAMLTVVRKPGVRDRLVRNASEFVSRYDWTSNQYRYLEIVDRLVGKNAQARTAHAGNHARSAGL